MTTVKRSIAARQAQRNTARKDGTAARQRLSYDERRAQFVDAGRAVFIEKGLQGARTRDIADQIGVTDALIYNYFESKTALFEAAILEPLERLLNDLVEAGTGYGDIETSARVSSSYAAHRTMLKAMEEITPLLIVALSSEQAEEGDFYKRRVVPLLDRFTAGLGENLQGWAHPDVDPKLLARMLLGTYVWTTIDSQFRGEKLDADQISKGVADFFIRGMTGPAGRAVKKRS